MRIDRRSLLRIGAALVVAALVPRPARPESKAMLTLLDPNLTRDEFASARSIAGASARVIEPDLVRQWRDGLGSEIAHAAGAVAYVRWDKALLLEGLARESGISSRHRQLERSLFEIRMNSAQGA